MTFRTVSSHDRVCPARKRTKLSTWITARARFPTGRLPQHLPLQDLRRPEWQSLVAVLRAPCRFALGMLSYLSFLVTESPQEGGEKTRIVGVGG